MADQKTGDVVSELTNLIRAALALADAATFSLVAIHLDEALASLETDTAS